MQRTARTPDGRTLAIEEAGDPDGRPVLVHWLAAHIPGVEARLLDHDGHLTLIENRVGEVHAWLAGRL